MVVSKRVLCDRWLLLRDAQINNTESSVVFSSSLDSIFIYPSAGGELHELVCAQEVPVYSTISTFCQKVNVKFHRK